MCWVEGDRSGARQTYPCLRQYVRSEWEILKYLLLTEADDLVVSGTAVDDVARESIVADEPHELKRSTRDFANTPRVPNQCPGKLESLRI